MSRLDRAPRRSPILGLAEAPAAAPAEQAAADEMGAPPEAQGGSGTASMAAVGGPSDPLPERRQKVGGFYALPSQLARMRACQFHTQTQPNGYTSLSALIVGATLGTGPTVVDLEREYNDGQPFPPVPAGTIKHSRRNST